MGKKPVPPVFIIDEKLDNKFDLESIEPNILQVLKLSRSLEETKKYTNQNNGEVKIYTKDFVLTELKRLIKAKSKEKIVLPDYDR
ncbi:MAG: hypothetical protein R2750_13375 [Bacteroidales bacterium]